jgi:hypothetical protein
MKPQLMLCLASFCQLIAPNSVYNPPQSKNSVFWLCECVITAKQFSSYMHDPPLLVVNDCLFREK